MNRYRSFSTVWLLFGFALLFGCSQKSPNGNTVTQPAGQLQTPAANGFATTGSTTAPQTAAALDSANKAAGSAAGLNSTALAANPTNGRSAATADDSKSASGGGAGGGLPDHSHSTSGSNPLALSAPSSGSSGGGGSAPSMSGGGGAPIGFGNMATAPTATASTQPTMASNGANTGMYSGGGGMGGKLGRGSDNPFGSLLGGGDGGLTAGAKTASFGDGRGPASIAAAGTPDPSDYFDRISEREDIFKVVERRYQKTTMQWARQ